MTVRRSELERGVTFLDDRNLAAASAEQDLRLLQSWQDWTQALGLEENMRKLKIVCRSARTELAPFRGQRHVARVICKIFGHRPH